MFQSYFAPHIGSLTHINMRLTGKLAIKPSRYEKEPRVRRLVGEGGMIAVMADTDHQVSAREKTVWAGFASCWHFLSYSVTSCPLDGANRLKALE
jgi:hypothetical protein